MNKTENNVKNAYQRCDRYMDILKIKNPTMTHTDTIYRRTNMKGNSSRACDRIKIQSFHIIKINIQNTSNLFNLSQCNTK